MHKSVIIGVDVDVLRISGECYGSANIEPSHSRSLAELKNRIYIYIRMEVVVYKLFVI